MTDRDKTSSFADAVKSELCFARSKHPKFNSLHEGYAVLLEELDEVWDEVRKKKEDREPFKVWQELIQISAMAQRLAEDVVLEMPNKQVQEKEITP